MGHVRRQTARPAWTPGPDRSFSAIPDSVVAARVLVTTWLRAAMPGENLLIDDVALAISEACTNAVIHAYPSADREGAAFHVLAERDGDTVRVTVSDQGTGMGPRPESPGLGLGLPLIASITDAVEMRPPLDGSGTVVAMRFSAAGANTRAAEGAAHRNGAATVTGVTGHSPTTAPVARWDDAPCTSTASPPELWSIGCAREEHSATERIEHFLVMVGQVLDSAMIGRVRVRLTMSDGRVVEGVPRTSASDPSRDDQLEDTGYVRWIDLAGARIDLADVREAAMVHPSDA